MKIVNQDVISINEINGDLTINNFFNTNDTDIDGDGNSEGSVQEQQVSFQNNERFLVVMNKREIDLFRESVYNLSPESDKNSSRNLFIRQMKNSVNKIWDETRNKDKDRDKDK